jgi:hypothetical protein
VPSQYLYVIAESAEGRGPVKLGISANPDRRLKQLQTAHPGVLTVHYKAEVPAHKAKPLERLLHRDMSFLRLRGEWFDMSVQQAIHQVMFTLMRYEDELP